MAKKLEKLARHLELVRRILTNGIWVAILVILLATGGWLLMQTELGRQIAGQERESGTTTRQIVPPVDWAQIDAAVAAVLQAARLDAEQYAERELDLWTAGLMERVDGPFLDWYFGYWTQQLLGLKGLYQYGVHHVIRSQPSAAEKLTEEIQAEFAQRVLQPQTAQKILERIVQQTVERYVDFLRAELGRIPAAYGLGQAAWHDYLEDVAITTQAAEGDRQTPLTLKALTVSGAGGAVVLSSHIKVLLSKIGAKMTASSSGKVASAVAASSGAKVAAKIGGKFFGAITGVGVLVWDLWDHRITERENRPLLRQALQDYFTELKYVLLHDSEFGIMSTFTRFEHQLAARD